MANQRDHFRYELRDHRKVVYVGITNDPERREEDHDREGKRFTSMTIVGPAVTKDSALDWEEDRLDAYRQSHGGANPRYNET